MGLSLFIREHEQPIISEWEKFARSVPIAVQMDRVALRDHVAALLQFVADDLDTYQSPWEQSEKSKGRSEDSDLTDSAGESHAEQRFTGGFDTVEMISEFRALRASVVKLWGATGTKSETDFQDLIRFNEAIDQILTESLARYTKKQSEARTLFLGTLMHDLGNPLNAVVMSAEILSRYGNLEAKQAQLVSQIYTSGMRISELVSILIDEVRIRLGKGLPLSPSAMDMEETLHQTVMELRAANPQRPISLVTSGNLQGEWDKNRMAQVLSNLIGNAIQHGDPGKEIKVDAKETPEGIMVLVHNDGTSIPSALQATIFDPMTRGTGDAQVDSKDSSLGLGLFITKAIIEAHGGRIEVLSNETEGTTFTIKLPFTGAPAHTF